MKHTFTLESVDTKPKMFDCQFDWHGALVEKG